MVRFRRLGQRSSSATYRPGHFLCVACGCGSHQASQPATSTSPSLSGSWTVQLTMNGTTQNLFQATLTQEAQVASGCNVATQQGTIASSALGLSGCFIADDFSGQGSLSCPPCIFQPQAILVYTTANSDDIGLLVLQSDPVGAIFEFSGNGVFAGGMMSGNWVCDSLTTCQGWSGSLTATQD
jgi:hypothetical protein